MAIHKYIETLIKAKNNKGNTLKQQNLYIQWSHLRNTYDPNEGRCYTIASANNKPKENLLFI